MSTGTTVSTLFTEVADAIRNKSHSTDPITARDFPTVIEQMQAGSAIEMYSTREEMNVAPASIGQLAIVYTGSTYQGLFEYNGSSYVELPRA